MYTTRQSNNYVVELLASRNQAFLAVLFNKRGDALGDVKFVRVRIGRLGLLELLDRTSTQLKILLHRVRITAQLLAEITHIRVQVILICGCRLRCSLRWCGSGLVRLLRIPFALLLATLQLTVRDDL